MVARRPRTTEAAWAGIGSGSGGVAAGPSGGVAAGGAGDQRERKRRGGGGALAGGARVEVEEAAAAAGEVAHAAVHHLGRVWRHVLDGDAAADAVAGPVAAGGRVGAEGGGIGARGGAGRGEPFAGEAGD